MGIENNAANGIEGFPELQRYSWLPDPPKEKSFDIGIDGLKLKVPQKGLAVFPGPPGSGKSTFGRQMTFNMARMHGWRTLLTCFEEDVKWRTSNAFQKMFWSQFDKDFWIDGDSDGSGAKWIDEHLIFLVKQKRKLLNGWRLIDIVDEAFRAGHADMAVIDPWNEIDHSWDAKKGNKTDYIGTFLMELKDMAHSHGKLVVICCHPPAQIIRAKRMQKNQYYEISDIAESSHFGNKSDLGLVFWYEPKLKRTILNVDKVKNQEAWGRRQGYSLKFNVTKELFTVDKVGWENIYAEE